MPLPLFPPPPPTHITGYPQFTETGILKEYITQQGYKLKILEDDDNIQNKAAAPTDTITGPLPGASGGEGAAREATGHRHGGRCTAVRWAADADAGPGGSDLPRVSGRGTEFH